MSENDKPFNEKIAQHLRDIYMHDIYKKNEKSRVNAQDIKAIEEALKAKTGYSAEKLRAIISGTPGQSKEKFFADHTAHTTSMSAVEYTLQNAIRDQNGTQLQPILDEYAEKLSEIFPGKKNVQTVSDKNPNETQKNSAGDAINPKTGLPKINWDAHKKFRP